MTEFAPDFDPEAFGAEIAGLLRSASLMELGPGSPRRELRSALAAIAKTDVAKPALAGLWLLGDFLDESHEISQDLPDRAGAYWHGIMHRREPDAGNAAYWFRRVGDHPIFPKLAALAPAVLDADVAVHELLDGRGRWNPFAFVDLCENARDAGTPQETALRRLQWLEWQLLFSHSWRDG